MLSLKAATKNQIPAITEMIRPKKNTIAPTVSTGNLLVK
jgi:hypothetical protein